MLATGAQPSLFGQGNNTELLASRSRLSSEMQLRIIDPCSDSGWDQQVLSHPEATFFHSAAWARVLSNSYSHQPLYLQLSHRGDTSALMPLMEVRSRFTGRRGVGLPFSDFCAPLLFHANAREFLGKTIFELGRDRRWTHCEVRGGSTFGAAMPGLSFYGHQLSLRASLEELFANCSSPVRRAVRKAERSTLKIRIASTCEALRSFYRLHLLTRRRHGLPPQPWSFFLQIHEHVMQHDLGFVVLAEENSIPVAGAVFFEFANKAIFKFGASIRDSQAMRGNDLVMWEAIKLLKQRGLDSLHFGRTSLGNAGLRRFKLAWGVQENRIEYFRIQPSAATPGPAEDSAFGFHNRIFRTMPLALNRLAGTIIYPHLD